MSVSPAPSPTDELRELARMVQLMRVAQSAYFKHKDSRTLARAKQLEKDVDSRLSDILRQPTLF